MYRFPVRIGTTGPVIPRGVWKLPRFTLVFLSVMMGLSAVYSFLGFYRLLFLSFYLPDPVALLGGEIQGGSTGGGISTTGGSTGGGTGTSSSSGGSSSTGGGTGTSSTGSSTGSDTYSYGWDDECPECDYDCSRCGDNGGGDNDNGGPGPSNCNAQCACPGNNQCNCPFNDACYINPCCYNPGGGKIPRRCPHCSLFG